MCSALGSCGVNVVRLGPPAGADVWAKIGRISNKSPTAPFTIAKTRKPPKCSSTEEWIGKMWYIYITEYYSAIKKNELMPFAATRMDLQSVILSEVSQTEEKYYMTSLIRGI